ncbi:MAG TPA: hypothetical protein VII11_03090, partial [Bacteroidota bacterium]
QAGEFVRKTQPKGCGYRYKTYFSEVSNHELFGQRACIKRDGATVKQHALSPMRRSPLSP